MAAGRHAAYRVNVDPGDSVLLANLGLPDLGLFGPDLNAHLETPAGRDRAGLVHRHRWRSDGESLYGYLMTRRIERAMALLRRGDLSVTEVCFAVGCSSLGTFSTRFTELVVSSSTYRCQAGQATAGMPSCVAKQVTRPIRNREAPLPERS